VTFSNLTTTTPRAATLPWPALREKLSSHQERTHKDGPLWSPAVYRDGMTRSNAAVESVTALVFDVDHAEPDWSLLEGYEYVAHTTFRYTADDPRWRIVLPLTRPVPAAEWIEVGARARAALCPLADTSCKDAARAFYTPACLPGGARFTQRGSGVAVDPAALPSVPPEPTPDAPYTLPAGPTGGRPGDDYAARGSWGELLAAHGWVHESTMGEEQRWRRPDKRKGAGISATIGHKGRDILYVFSSSVPPFEAQKGYSKFHVYTLLEHDGDFRAAAKALAAQGFGAPSPPPLRVDTSGRTNGHAAPAPPPPTESKGEPTGAAPDHFEVSDLGNAERLIEAYGTHLRYCPQWGKWLVYDGTRWAIDADECRVRACARLVVRQMGPAADAFRTTDPERALKLFKHALKSEKAGALPAMVGLARTFEKLWVTFDALDADPWLLNVLNGTIDLRTGALLPHTPAQLLTKLAPITYDPAAACPRWEACIAEVTSTAGGAADPALATYLQRALGHSLTGTVSEQVVYFAHGKGANGKSTVMNTFRQMLGEYAMQAGEGLLTIKRGETHPTEQADLFRMRAVLSTEIEDGQRLAEALVKRLSGGEHIRARRMREDLWEFAPTHTVWIAANHRPEIRGTDYAIWRRIRLMPFDVTFYECAEQAPVALGHRVMDPQLMEHLQAELAGILAWTVRGCLDWQRHGIALPARVKAATEAYRQSMDVLEAFLADRCVIMQQATTESTALYKAYQRWCEDTGERAESHRKFGERLGERGFGTGRAVSGRIVRLGVALQAEPAPDQPSKGSES